MPSGAANKNGRALDWDCTFTITYTGMCPVRELSYCNKFNRDTGYGNYCYEFNHILTGTIVTNLTIFLTGTIVRNLTIFTTFLLYMPVSALGCRQQKCLLLWGCTFTITFTGVCPVRELSYCNKFNNIYTLKTIVTNLTIFLRELLLRI